MNGPTSVINRRSKYSWNYFTEDVKNNQSVSEKKYDKSLENKYKWLKGITMATVFCVTLLAGIVSKGATIFMVGQIGTSQRHHACWSDFNLPNLTTSARSVFVELTPTEKVGWYWGLFFSFIAPEVLTLGRSLRVVLMKSYKTLSILDGLLVFVFETIHVTGTFILFMVALPGLDSLRAIMATNAVALVPAFLKIFYDMKPKINPIPLVLNIVALVVQISALLVWPLADKADIDIPWSLPVGLLMMSFGWWEVYVREEGPGPIFKKLWEIKTKMTDGTARAPTYIIISIWKMGFFLLLMSLVVPSITSQASEKLLPSIDILYSDFVRSFNFNEYFLITEDSQVILQVDELVKWDVFWESPAFVLTVQVVCTFIAYIFGCFACKCNIQEYCFAIPVTLITPICVAALSPLCVNKLKDACSYSSTFPRHLFFDCPAEVNGPWFYKDDLTLMWILFFFSHAWITIQIWKPKNDILLATPQIFSTDYYSSLMIDASMMLNRREDDGKTSTKYDKRTKHIDQMHSQEDVVDSSSRKKEHKHTFYHNNIESKYITDEDRKIRIKGCATMWHENSEEIEVCLKSIFLIDEDYCVRHLAESMRGITDDIYEWESHIFFDDCMSVSSEDGDYGRQIVNSFVVDLVKTVDSYGKKWYGRRGLNIDGPIKILTPYGGRLIWSLPGGTKLICHLKDKNKIRHKKRWSQIMYMYYFLGYQLLENDKLRDEQKDVRAANTFLLALDGDVDFQPEAVIKVVDLITRNPKIGAACGRIHPTGNSYMQWYQNFEYAIGHWLQKSTEHVLGCVLCSPGCFSLFRGSAVMDNNVMRTYTTVAKRPQHYIQYDQGEDRWLCTLMLKQGWRVEYSAASDSFTACPLTFKEFYNQRRRWMPSTMLNVVDLISDWKAVVKANDDISHPYMVYQLFNLIGSIMGPGSIFLMMIGAFSLAFGMSSSLSLILNLILVGIFILACCTLKTDHQILLAQLLTLIYAIIMIAVIIGIIIQIIEDGPLSLSALGFFFTYGSFVVAAMLHPQEWTSLFCVFVYTSTIPSMYLLLTIYSLFNMNNVSWGTREVPKTEAEKQAEAMAASEAAKNKKRKEGILGYFQSLMDKKDSLGFSTLFSFNCFSTESKADKDMAVIADKLDSMEKSLKHLTIGQGGPGEGDDNNQDEGESKEQTKEEKKKKKGVSFKVDGGAGVRTKRLTFKDCAEKLIEDMKNPYWMEDNEINARRCEFLAKASREELEEKEKKFWKSMIKEYLLPLDENKEEKKKAQQELKEFKNSMSLAFVLLNSMWVTAIFMLQSNTEILGWRWPLGAKGPTLEFETGDLENMNQVVLNYEYLRLEPVGVVFVVAFIFVIFLQSIGMLFHRILTLEQIIAHTKFGEQGFQEKDLLYAMKDLNDNSEMEVDGQMKDKLLSCIDAMKTTETSSTASKKLKDLRNKSKRNPQQPQTIVVS